MSSLPAIPSVKAIHDPRDETGGVSLPPISGGRQVWHRCFDPQSHQYYFYNEETYESSWEQPPGYVEHSLNLTLISLISLQNGVRRYLVRNRLRHAREAGMSYADYSAQQKRIAAQQTEKHTLASRRGVGGMEVGTSAAAAAGYGGGGAGDAGYGYEEQTPATKAHKRQRCKICDSNKVYHMCMPCQHFSVCEYCFNNERDDMTGEFHCPDCMERVDELLHENDAPMTQYYMGAADWGNVLTNATYIDTIDQWDMYQDASSMAYFYYNRYTGVSQWESPFDDDEWGEEDLKKPAKHQHDPYAYEGLNDDNHAAWVPPDLTIATQAARAGVYSAGAANMWHTNCDDLAMLGVGVTLYFRLLKYLAVVLTIMSVIALPVLMLFGEGDRVPARSPDPIGFGKLTLGNLGSEAETWTFSQDPNSTTGSLFTGSNETYATILGRPFTRVGTSYYIAFTDFVYTWVFVLFLFWLHRRVDHIVEFAGRKTVSTSDFSVLVTGLPKHATEAEIRDHFSKLFRLDRKEGYEGDDEDDDEEDGGGGDGIGELKAGPSTSPTLGQLSPPKDAKAAKVKAFVSRRHMLVYTGEHKVERATVPGAGGVAVEAFKEFDATALKPVQDTSHIHDESYMNSWVAETTVVHPNGEAIRTYLDIKNLTAKLRAARARVKMYSDGTPFEDGPDDDKRRDAQDQVTKLGFEMNSIKIRLHERESQSKEECYAAFVVFNHEESFLRCLKAYARSRNPIYRFFQPEHLRFTDSEGDTHRLRVSRSKDPSDIIWENLETPAAEAAARRSATGCATFLAIVMSFVLLLIAALARENFARLIPNLAVCREDLPVTVLGSYDNFTALSDAASLRLGRPGQFEAGEADRACGSGRVHIQYYDVGVPYHPDACDAFAASDVAIEHASTQEGDDKVIGSSGFDVGCPNPDRPVQCPCADPAAAASCMTMPCFDLSLASDERECTSFPASTIVGCYCLQAFEAYVDELGSVSGAREFADKEEEVCGNWAANYAAAQALSGFAAACVAIINVVLKSIMVRLVEVEHHKTLSAKAGALSDKVFISQLINTAIIVVLVHAKMPVDPATGLTREFPIPGILQGEFDSFESGWYATVGVSIAFTMMINVFVPHLAPMLNWLIVLRSNRKKAAKQGTYLTQADMNNAVSGPRFDLSLRYPQVMSMLFTTLLYCGGMPVLLPMAVFSVTLTFWLDKALLLRYLKKPPAYDDRLAKQAISWMPWGILLHVGVSVWMYGEDSILKSLVIDPSIISAQTGRTEEESVALYERWLERSRRIDGIGLTAKITRVNAFPLFLLFCFLFFGIVFSKTVGSVMFTVIAKIRRKISRGGRVAPDRKWLAPFTADFAKILDDKGHAEGDAKDDDSSESEAEDDDDDGDGDADDGSGKDKDVSKDTDTDKDTGAGAAAADGKAAAPAPVAAVAADGIAESKSGPPPGEAATSSPPALPAGDGIHMEHLGGSRKVGGSGAVAVTAGSHRLSVSGLPEDGMGSKSMSRTRSTKRMSIVDQRESLKANLEAQVALGSKMAGSIDSRARKHSVLNASAGQRAQSIVAAVTAAPVKMIKAPHKMNTKRKLTKLEKAQGWRITDRDGLPVLQKTWVASRSSHGKYHAAGSPKLTWEVIADTGIHSYRIHFNPAYKEALRAMNEGIIHDEDENMGSGEHDGMGSGEVDE